MLDAKRPGAIALHVKRLQAESKNKVRGRRVPRSAQLRLVVSRESITPKRLVDGLLVNKRVASVRPSEKEQIWTEAKDILAACGIRTL